MLSEHKRKSVNKVKRALRVRKKTKGTPERPRLSVVKTNMHIYAQIIDDANGKTIASASTQSKEFKNSEYAKKNKASARKLGENIAEKAKKLNISSIVFDRGAQKYHGILKELADAARENGLKF
ncbi:MAG: 50S ribosomal protein L18 [Chlamydiales bacterium]